MAKTPDERREQNRIHAQEKRDADREAFRKYRREHYAKHREEIRAYQKANPPRTKEEVAEYNRQYREKNPDKIKANSKSYYWANRDRVLSNAKAWQKSHPEYDRERHRRNPARARAANGKRKALMRGADGSYRMKDISRLYFAQGGLCHCGIPLDNFDIDHIIPLSRRGTNWPWNLQLLCPPCNARKSNKMPTWQEIFTARPNLLTLPSLTRITADSDVGTISSVASGQVAR
jgi:5-methylcytosine-specific restriction endonuclease McrA